MISHDELKEYIKTFNHETYTKKDLIRLFEKKTGEKINLEDTTDIYDLEADFSFIITNAKNPTQDYSIFDVEFHYAKRRGGRMFILSSEILTYLA